MDWILGLILSGASSVSAMPINPCHAELTGQPRKVKSVTEDNISVVNPAGKTRTLIFVPGGPGLGFDYLPAYFKQLANHYRLVFYNPGYSFGFKAAGLDRLTAELRELTERAGGDVVGFVSHSGGTLILTRFFEKYGAQPAAVISGVTDMEWVEIYMKENPTAHNAGERLQAANVAVRDTVVKLRNRMLNYVNDYFPPMTRALGVQLFDHNRYFPEIASGVEKELAEGVSTTESFACARAPLLLLGGRQDRVI